MTEPVGELEQLTRAVGLLETWVDAKGRPQHVSSDTLRALLAGLGLSADSQADIRNSLHTLQGERTWEEQNFRTVLAGETLTLDPDKRGSYLLESEDGRAVPGILTAPEGSPASFIAPDTPGYYQLRMSQGMDMTLAVAPRHPVPFGPLAGATKHWGLAAQIYSLRREADDAGTRIPGHGDFGAVRELAKHAAAAGADVLALSPMHAMFSAAPTLCSPYSPSNRLLLNVLYADPVAVLGEAFIRVALADQPVAQWAALEGAPLIVWAESGQARLNSLRALHARFLTHAPESLAKQYAAFLDQAPPMLEAHALFETMHAQASAQNGKLTAWQDWPEDWRTPDSAASAEFAERHVDEVDFHRFAQWLAHASLAQAQATAKQGGMRIGLLADLAVGSSPLGSQAWSRPHDYVLNTSVGAPPDAFNAAGQTWGLLAPSPRALRTGRYAPFIELLRANLAHTGGVRVDHILGLARLWLVPEGCSATAGAYLRYPAETLFRLASLEAWRHHALLVGENLGTVPPEFNPMMRAHGMAGMSVLWFTRTANAEDNGTEHGSVPGAEPFLAPEQWPADSVGMATTHDLPTLRGWWEARDIDLKEQIGIETDIAEQRSERDQSRQSLWQAIKPGATSKENTTVPKKAPIEAMLQYVAESSSVLTTVTMEDLEALREQPNLPFSPTEPSNWCRRLPRTSAAMFDDPSVKTRLDAARKGRQKP